MSAMGLFDVAAGLVRVVPGGELPARLIEQSGRVLKAVENAAVKVLADRILAVSAPTGLALEAPRTDRSELTATPAALLDELLARSVRGSSDHGHDEYYRGLLRQLVPDEARILAKLATGHHSPVVSILRRGNGSAVLENASLVGRTAAVTVPSRTPAYVTHLLQLGLVELGPEDPDAGTDYELLLADRAVRDALREGQLGKVPARVVRATVRLSDAGRDLWAAARPEVSL